MLLTWFCSILEKDFWLCLSGKLSSGSRIVDEVHRFWSYNSNRRNDWWLATRADTNEAPWAPHVYAHGVQAHPLGAGVYFSLLRDCSGTSLCLSAMAFLWGPWPGLGCHFSPQSTSVSATFTQSTASENWVLMTPFNRMICLPPKCFTVFWLRLRRSAFSPKWAHSVHIHSRSWIINEL